MDLADALRMWAPLPKKVYVSLMSIFDYTASARLFAAKGCSTLRRRHFAQAGVAIRDAVELPPKEFSGTSLEAMSPTMPRKFVLTMRTNAILLSVTIAHDRAGHADIEAIRQDIHAVSAGSIDVTHSPHIERARSCL